MPRQRPDRDVYYPPSHHFNVRCEGDINLTYVPLRDLKELRAEIIHSVWCVELKRELTRQEIVQLCSVR